MGKQRKPRRTVRVYYGMFRNGKQQAYWTVKAKDATRGVTVNGTLSDALLGTPGSTIGCHLSRCVMNNEKAFGHPAYLASFTKTRCFIINKLKNGTPVEAIRYAHDYGNLVEINDKDSSKSFIKKNPELAERQFTLSVPQQDKRVGRPSKNFSSAPGKNVSTIPRGALARAIDAGLITPGLGSALT